MFIPRRIDDDYSSDDDIASRKKFPVMMMMSNYLTDINSIDDPIIIVW